ncbi:MAG: HEAT repeat domain-containing protein [Acidobacteria bacterium]|nr:HEAT repeat domain-containing protein [Acidobacteriota bacterium]
MNRVRRCARKTRCTAPRGRAALCRSLRPAALLLVLALAFDGAARADEPYARSRDYDLQNARIALRFDLEQHKVNGEVTHTLAPLRDGLTRLAFDSVALSVSSVMLSGQPAKFETTATQLLVALDQPAKIGDKLEVTIRYEGRPKKGLYFVMPDKNYPDRAQEVWTQGEAEDTRYYIPIYDYPNDRTATEMILTVPAAWATVSNGKLLGVTDAGGGMRTWHWRQSLPHSTYLISLVAGEFEVSKETWRNIPVSYYVPRGKSDRVTPTFARTRQMLEFYSGILGVPYPWDQYAQAAVNDFVAGGMENTSATTITVNGLQHPQLAGESRQGSDGLIAHELAHQWFGDLVTCKDWANVWLNEGFATYFGSLWEEHQYGAEEAAYSLWQSRNSWLGAQRLYAVPIVTRDFTEATVYAGNTYTKAAWVLHMLRVKLGDAAFYRAMKHYLEAYRGQNVVAADLVKAIEEATLTNVDLFFDQWVYGAGAPRFRVSYTYDEATREVKLTVEQTQKIEGRVGLFRVPVEVEITTAAAKKSFLVQVSKASENLTFAVDGPPLLVLFDKDHKVLKSVEFSKTPREWIYQLKDAQSVPARLDAAQALGEVKNKDDAVTALGEAALTDPFWGVRAEALRALGRIGGPAAQERVLAALANDKPWVRQVAVEQMANFKDDASVARRLETLFREDKAYRVRAAALATLAVQKPANAFEILESAAATDSPDDRLRVAALRGLGTLGDDRAVPVLLEWSAAGKPFAVRAAAIGSLGQLDKKNKELTQKLLAYLPENYRSVQFATISALGQRGDAQAIGPLEALIKSGDLSQGLEDFAQSVMQHLKQPNANPEKKEKH